MGTAHAALQAAAEAEQHAGFGGDLASVAPAFVVRAASFPIRTLLELADESLAALAVEATTGTDSARRAPLTIAYEAAYGRVMQQQQRILMAATVADPAFMKALCLTNDDLSRRIAASGPLRETRNKRTRQLAGTLYRYLARATWRTEPCDLWAGVAIGRWGERTESLAVAPRLALAPDLGPYQALVQALAATEPYVARGLYKLNPTLHLDEEEACWRFTVRSGTTVLHERRPRSAGLDAMLYALAAMEPASLHELSARLRGEGAPADPSLDEMLAALLAVGLLVGGLAFPRRFGSAWDALAQVPPLLAQAHARPWWSSVRRLRRLCRRLERQLPSMTVTELHAALDEARQVPQALARALGLPAPALPRSVLRCDVGLPFVPVFGPELRTRLLQAAEAYDQFERQHGVDLAARTAHRHLVAGLHRSRASDAEDEPAAVPTQEAAWRATGADPVLGERLGRWSRWLESKARTVTVEPDTAAKALELPPIGGLVVRLGRDRLRIIGTTTEIGASYGRYGPLWYGLAQRARRRFAGHPLHVWYGQVLAEAGARAGLEPVEYVGPCEGMPNALARPDFGVRCWDRWGTASSFREDQVTMTMLPAGATKVPLLRFASRERPAAIFCFSPVNLGFSEPTLERMLLSSFRELPLWLGPGLPLRCELGRDRPTPALKLPGGEVVRPRRLFVYGEALAELAAASSAERFLRWQALARRHQWPAIVLVARDGRRPLPVVRDSPLAVEAALQGLREGVRFLSIEEPDDQAWTVDHQGLAYSMEVIVPYLRRRHAWSGLAPG
jgi:hypothetical protein